SLSIHCLLAARRRSPTNPSSSSNRQSAAILRLPTLRRMVDVVLYLPSSSLFSISLCLSLASKIHFGVLYIVFNGSTALIKFELYFGLLVFVDIQETIEKAHLGDMDWVKHTLTPLQISLLLLSVFSL
ncbi:unnamed protein product, partial [Citrullus colocynthis]